MSDPSLSVVCTLGPHRGRAERMVSAMGAQSAAGSIELLLVSALPEKSPPGQAAEIPIRSVRYPAGAPLGEARAAGLREARGEIVAFLTDHTYPEPDWAEALIRAYREGPWAAVGYAFRNANPDTYGSRAAMMADFAPWLAPTRSGETDFIPPNDGSFRRSILTGLGDEIAELLTAEPLLIEELRSRGHRLSVSAEAVVAHACLPTIRDNGRSTFNYCRALAAIQLRRERWGGGARLVHALLSALGAPLIRTTRAAVSLGRSSGGALILHLPGIPFHHLMAGLGQALGYIAGGNGAARRLARWETAAVRDDR